jgi:hypothetical protein
MDLLIFKGFYGGGGGVPTFVTQSAPVFDEIW